VEIEGLSGIDWTAPWLAPFSDLGREIAAAGDWRGALNREARQRSIATGSGRPLVFDAAEAAGDRPYETFIADTGRVPTRANLHDFFNALVWLVFPRSKGRLNALQAQAIARAGVAARRGALRDAATLIDENAALLVTERAELVDALRRHAWDKLFRDERAAWNGEIRVLAFGHALLQKLVHPYKAITAHALHAALPAKADASVVDATVAAQLDEQLSPRMLLPLPVLGIPGWWSANADPAFYTDTSVFRPAG
jgi:hypothetical protein